MCRVGQSIYTRCIHGIFGREITEYTIIYGVHIRFWPTLCMYRVDQDHIYRDWRIALYEAFL